MNGQPGEADNGVDRIGRLTADGELHGYFAADPGRTIEVDHVMGCNMSFRRDVLALLGGFREDYPGISGVREDSDMCVRVRQRGYKIMFAPQAAMITWAPRSARAGGLTRAKVLPVAQPYWSCW